MQLRFGLAGFAMSNMIAAVGDELVCVPLAICPMCVCAYTWLNSLLLRCPYPVALLAVGGGCGRH